MAVAFDSRHFDPEVARELGRVDLVARVIAQGVFEGLHKSRRRGFSTEFSDFRQYAPGDDIRFLDWRLFARTDKLFIKCFEADTETECLLVLDATRSMAWRWRGRVTKLEYGANLLAALGCLHIRQRDPVGLLVHDGRTLHALPPRANRLQLDAMCAVLERIEPAGGNTFIRLVEAVAGARRHRGQIAVCSDLEEDAGLLDGALAELASHDDEVALFHVLDAAEEQAPFARATELEDAETGVRLRVRGRAAWKRHARHVEAFRGRWRTRCRELGIQYQPVRTDRSYVDVLREYLEERAAR